jgi:tRNA nucleotidyltransferase (CCA-adding enzyme)
LELIDQLGLYHAIFTDPAKADFPRPGLSAWATAYNQLDRLRTAQGGGGSLYGQLVQSEEEAYIAWNLVAVAPWENVTDSRPDGTKLKTAWPLPALAVREGIKGTNKLCDVVTASHQNFQEILDMKTSVCASDPVTQERDIVGMAIRKWDAHIGHWKLQVLYALLVESMDVGGLDPNTSASTSLPAKLF